MIEPLDDMNAKTLLAALLLLPTAASAAPTCQSLAPYLAEADKAIHMVAEWTGPLGFNAYRRVVAGSLRNAGQNRLAARVEALEGGRPVPPQSSDLASCLLRHYTVARYGERIVADLRSLVGFRTYAEEGRENWNAPEFVRQREWLEKRTRDLRLAFKSYDGRVEEITLPGPSPILAVLTHGDVQDVANQQWSSPPWEGRRVGEGGSARIVGRGTEDDKGPIAAALWSLAALRDTGWTLSRTVRLLVANGEESSWDEIPYYLERAPMPDMTFGVDAAYPVTHAQKGYGVVTFRAQGMEEPKTAEWRVVRMSGGSGMSIIPEKGEAWVEGRRYPESAEAELSRLATAWAVAHPPARLTVTREGVNLHVTAEGKGGHSSEPHSGHNALGDLTAFLATLDLRMDAWGALAAFTGSVIGTEMDGRSLGVAHHDEVMGSLTSNLSFLREDQGAPIAEINLRVPRGLSNEEITKRIAARAADFQKRTGAVMTMDSKLLSEPHLAPTDGKLVSTLLAVWKEVTGTPGHPIAIGGGTQARLFQGGVDFGPALDMEHYRGHGTDEYLTVNELHRIAELTVTALWRLAG
jgi:dipeptidase D